MGAFSDTSNSRCLSSNFRANTIVLRFRYNGTRNQNEDLLQSSLIRHRHRGANRALIQKTINKVKL